jgi:cell division protein ZapB
METVNRTRGDVESEDLRKLESRIDELISTCQRLRQENQNLKNEQGVMNDRHAKLMEKTRIARERIESMIGRLKALERSNPS